MLFMIGIGESLEELLVASGAADVLWWAGASGIQHPRIGYVVDGLAQLVDLVLKIVAIEGPIHTDEVARRVSAAFGKVRTGSRIIEAVNRAITFACRHDPAIRRDGPFLMTEAQADETPVRDRSAETGALIKAAMIPPVEIAAAARLVRDESGDVPEDDLKRAVARLMGFQRVGSDLDTVISEVLRSA